MKLHACGHKGKLILKMGGLICPVCRTILFWPGSPEYTKRLKKALK